MLEVSKKRHGISYSYVWFADVPSIVRAWRPVVYVQCSYQGQVIGYRRQRFYTILIDLAAEAETLLKSMSKSTSYQAKRARREGVEIRHVDDVDEFVAFYNAFAASKSRARINREELFGWGEQTVAVAAVSSEGETLAMHSYVVDRSRSRARLLHSASQFRGMEDSERRNAVGRANRYLHYAAMLHFKDAGVATYDMGGYAKDSDDQEMAAIARFKSGFGGEVVREDRYVSLPMQLMQAVGGMKQWLRRRAARAAKRVTTGTRNQLSDNANLSAGMTSTAKRSM